MNNYLTQSINIKQAYTNGSVGLLTVYLEGEIIIQLLCKRLNGRLHTAKSRSNYNVSSALLPKMVLCQNIQFPNTCISTFFTKSTWFMDIFQRLICSWLTLSCTMFLNRRYLVICCRCFSVIIKWTTWNEIDNNARLSFTIPVNGNDKHRINTYLPDVVYIHLHR